MGGLQAGQAGSTSRTRGTILQGLVTVGNDVVEGGLGYQSFELGSRGDVHTALSDPIGLEAAAGADVEVGGDSVDKGLVSAPARLGGVEGRQEVSGAFEVLGFHETKALLDVLTLRGEVIRSLELGQQLL